MYRRATAILREAKSAADEVDDSRIVQTGYRNVIEAGLAPGDAKSSSVPQQILNKLTPPGPLKAQPTRTQVFGRHPQTDSQAVRHRVEAIGAPAC
jgi:hypothetical protein